MEKQMRESPVVQLPELFRKMEGERVAPNIVLLRGKAGVGKSTLVKRIASEWAVGELWADVFSHVFVVTLRDLLEGKWTIGQLLLSEVQLPSSDHTACTDYISQHASSCLILIDGLDEVRDFNYHKSVRFPDLHTPVEVSLLLSGLIGNTIFSGAKVLITSRPFQVLPIRAFKRTIELYGFPKESIHDYVRIYSEGKEELQPFIMKNLGENVNLMTLCYIPILCKFVCRSLENLYKHGNSGDMQAIKTMTRLYENTTTNSARNLHPRMKGEDSDIDENDILNVVKDVYRKYADLAKMAIMTHPLKIVFYKSDLSQAGLDEGSVDGMQCGIMTPSRKRNRRNDTLHVKCYSFNHLTLQEYFSAIGLLQGSSDDEVMKLVKDKGSVIKHEIVLMFTLGLCGDESFAHYRQHLLSPMARDVLRTLVEKLAKELEDDQMKLVTLLHETQDASVLDVVSSTVVRGSTVFPTEMRALCWVLEKETCHITSLE